MVAKYSVYKIMKWLLIGHALTLMIYILFTVDSLYVVRVMQGVVTAFFSMAMQLGITEVLKDRDRGQGMAMYSLSTVMPSLYGPALALMLWGQWSLDILLITVGILAILPFLFFVKSPLPKREQPNASFSLKELFVEAIALRKNKALLISSITMVIGSAIFGALTIFIPLYMVVEGEGNAPLYLFLQALVVVGSRYTLKKYIPSDGKWHPTFISLVLLSSTMGTLILAFASSLGNFVYVASIFNGFATAMLYPTLTTYISFVIPKEKKHVLFGLFLASYDLGFSLGGLILGFVVQFTSYSTMFVICSFMTLAVIFVIYYYRYSIDNEPNIHLEAKKMIR
ncbi:staphylopine family metallophore export MFS transporter CntE [Alkalihalobacillus sp. 1P02AB]|uniref:staphylopine family metallophore export MFS transporter CntE n=1 Tax=Alkalihalobacillus sp. 1P02AB TaxID=3132260 RepID=UPI0039A5B569